MQVASTHSDDKFQLEQFGFSVGTSHSGDSNLSKTSPRQSKTFWIGIFSHTLLLPLATLYSTLFFLLFFILRFLVPLFSF